MEPITLVHLYPRQMNMYGDRGNVLALRRRLAWHGYECRVLAHEPGAAFPEECADLVVGGGGQGSNQADIEADLQVIGDTLRRLADENVPMLVVCGLYQLFGRSFTTEDGRVLKGLGILPAVTEAGPKRLIGNTVVQTKFGRVVGYENHSGRTYLDDTDLCFGRVVKGRGNNGEDDTEGAVYRCVLGTYLHGSLMPRNPAVADTLIARAVTRRLGSFSPGTIDDTLADRARAVAERRPR